VGPWKRRSKSWGSSFDPYRPFMCTLYLFSACSMYFHKGTWDLQKKSVIVRGNFEWERVGRAFPLLKCLRTHYGRYCEPLPAKNGLDCMILHIKSQNFPRVILPDPHRNAPGVWTQTPISAWLASVPIVPVLRNDHCVLSCHQPIFLRQTIAYIRL